MVLLLLGALAVFGLFVLAGATPAAIGLLADVTEAYPDDRGAIMGLYSVFLGLGQISGSLIAGAAATAFGLDGIFVASMVLLVLAVVPLVFLRRHEHYLGGSGDRRLDRLDRWNLTRWTAANHVRYSAAPVTRRAHTKPSPVFHLLPLRDRRDTPMTSNVGQNYPYSSESEADRAARIAALVEDRDGLKDKLSAETTPLDERDRWWTWKCPTRAAPGSSTPRATRATSTPSTSSATGPAARPSCADPPAVAEP